MQFISEDKTFNWSEKDLKLLKVKSTKINDGSSLQEPNKKLLENGPRLYLCSQLFLHILGNLHVQSGLNLAPDLISMKWKKWM